MNCGFASPEKTTDPRFRTWQKRFAFDQGKAAPSPVHQAPVVSQAAGNLATQRLLRSSMTRPQLAISRPGGAYGYEADLLAPHGMRMPESTRQAACAVCESGGTPCPKCGVKEPVAADDKAESSVEHGGDTIGVTSQRVQELEGEEDYIGEVLGTFQEPDCNAFRASSACNPSNGNYEIQAIDDPCCSKGCTRKHEERHALDLGLCCWMLNDNIQNRIGNRDDLIKKYNDWLAAGARNWSECNAYGVSVQCAKAEIKANNCDKDDSQCCRELKFYLSEMGKQQRAYCEIAPKTKPPCPFTISPGPTP